MDFNDPNRTKKRVELAMTVSTRIMKLALRKRGSLKIESKEERAEKILKAAKEERAARKMLIGPNERYVLEIAAQLIGKHEDLFYTCAADSDANIAALRSLFERDGSLMILIQVQMDNSPAMESGRYDPKLKFTKIETALYSYGKAKKKIEGRSVVAYRLKNSHIVDPKNVAEEIFFACLPESDSVFSSIYDNLSKSIRPAIELSKDYGNCPENRKKDFIYGVDLFREFLRSTRSDIASCSTGFNIDNNFYKGFLLVPHQIEATAKNREKVLEVEKCFTAWMKQIKIIEAQGHHLMRDSPEDGPLVELEHWRRMLTRFNFVSEFSDSKPFRNYLKCLKLSRSKLVSQWKQTEQELILLLNEARDNVRFLVSLEKFWDPLYRCEPQEIIKSLPNLFHIIRAVFMNSSFYNTSVRMTGLMSKIVNQLIIASKNYLTKSGTISIWSENMKVLVGKIDECKKMNQKLRECFQKMLCDMADSGEKTFECSDKYLFEKLELFEKRLNKILEINQIVLMYQVLDEIKIVGLEVFAERIKIAYKIISGKSYDPLIHRDDKFDKDFLIFQTEIIGSETGMSMFVKKYLDPIETAEMRLLTLKRFSMLNLECFHLDRRYLDVAVMLEKEMEDIKDKYNEERADPPIAMDSPPVVGRIQWARSLLKKIEQPLNDLKIHQCVIEHPKAQITVKYYNFLARIFFHYEAMNHKAWFIYAETVRSRLESPLIRKDAVTNQYGVNLDPQVLQVIRETEGLLKLGLEVPETTRVLTYCKDVIFNAHNMTTALIERNNNIRRSILPIFTPLMRIQLIELERVFAPAISTVTWLSQNLDDYFKNVTRVIQSIESFVHEISDINDKLIENPIKSIEKTLLITLPEGAVTHEKLLQMNVEHRRNVEKKIAMKSLAAERAAIDLINKFIDKSGVPLYDDSGKYQLPPDEITEENWRVEELKPIDKYDWLSFEKLYKAVGFATPEENQKLVFDDFDGLKYDVNLLHIDCVELFAHYNHRIIAALAKCTKRSMELLKKRSNISAFVKIFTCEDDEKPLIKAAIELRIPEFKLFPKMQELQKSYQATLMNIIETNYAIPTWGKEAKTEQRKKRKPLIDEIRHEKHFFKAISEHKDVMRYKLSFDDGLLQMEAPVNQICEDLRQKYCFLWVDDRDEQLEKFVKSIPLIPDIRDMLQRFDDITEDIMNLDPFICVRTIEIDQKKMIDSLAAESKAWKSILGSKLSAYYKKILDETFDFIKTHQKKLERTLEDLDDCRAAMVCLESIREKFFKIDENVQLLESVYAVFAEFHLKIPAEDSDRVDSLRYIFKNLIKSADGVKLTLLKLQDPLFKELEEGVEKFMEDLKVFNENFIKIGPMVSGIPAKEAQDRVLLYDVILQELARRNETYSDGQRLFGLDVSEFPLLEKRKIEIIFLHKFFKLHDKVIRCVDKYSEALVREVSIDNFENELNELMENFESLTPAEGMENWERLDELKQKINDFLELCPALKLLTNPALKDDHWMVLETAMSYDFAQNSDNFTLDILINAPIMDHEELIGDVYIQALKDQELAQKQKKPVLEEE